MRRSPRRPKRRRYVRRFEEKCSFYANGNVVLVVRDGAIVTVIPRSWV
jgi:hypothetical protein